MKHTLLTMSHNDEKRLEEWIRYHSSIGFDRFIIILDNPVDGSEALLKRLSREFDIEIDCRAPSGDYYTGLSAADRFRKVQKWRDENRARLESIQIPVFDALTERQHLYFTEWFKKLELEDVQWIALIDVDEFIAIPGYISIQQLSSLAKTSRIRFLSFNFGLDEGNEPEWSLPLKSQFRNRWAREDLISYGKGWDTRVKTMALSDSTLPMVSVHPISKGSFEVLPFELARLHHYRIPDQAIKELPYRVTDLTLVNYEIRSRSRSFFERILRK